MPVTVLIGEQVPHMRRHALSATDVDVVVWPDTVLRDAVVKQPVAAAVREHDRGR
mgnify:CR=1 FL=1